MSDEIELLIYPSTGNNPNTAPPLEKMDHVAGYENVGFNPTAAPLPECEDAVAQDPPPEDRDINIKYVPRITEKEARIAFLEFVSTQCCYGKDPVMQMVIRDLQPSSAFQYTLETFTEKRKTSWTYKPYTGQPIDTPDNGPAPDPWDIQVHPPTMFKNQKSHKEVPHTASVKPCHDCAGIGRLRCDKCCGFGHSSCSDCQGRGTVERVVDGKHQRGTCQDCDGSGSARCNTCDGHGQVACKTCDTKGKLKYYIRLTIIWTNHIDDHIVHVECTSLPDELIRRASGQVTFEEELPRVWPINHFPDATINQASKQLVEMHNFQFQTEKILMQRHQVRIIPVTDVLYTWRRTDYNFYVFGSENDAWTSDYPQSCHKCCCTII